MMAYVHRESQIRANNKYKKENYEMVATNVAKGQKALIAEAAARAGVTPGKYMRDAVFARIDKEYPDIDWRSLEKKKKEPDPGPQD